MDRYLRATFITLGITAILIWVILATGCAYRSLYEAKIKGVCRHEAVYAAVVMGEKYPVRIAGGLWSLPGRAAVLHSVAQAKIGDTWEWLCIDFPSVAVCKGDPNFQPKHYYGLMEWIERDIALVGGVK